MHPQRHARASTSPTRCKNPEPFQMVFPHVIVFFSYYRFAKRWLHTLTKGFTWARKGKRKRKSKGRERKKERKGRRKGEEKEKKAVSHTDHFWCQKLSFSLPFCYRSWILCMFLFFWKWLQSTKKEWMEERICRALGGAGLGEVFPPSYIEQIFLIK